MTPLGLVSCNSFPSSCVLGVLIYEMGMRSPVSQKFGANAQALYQVGALSLLQKPHTESLGLEDFTVPAGSGIVAVDSLGRVLHWGGKHKWVLTVCY